MMHLQLDRLQQFTALLPFTVTTRHVTEVQLALMLVR
jgi:hypothetical protein